MAGTPEIAYRPATAGDATAVAPLLRRSGDGLFEFLFHDLDGSAALDRVLAGMVAAEAGAYSHRHTRLAVTGDDVVGFMTACPPQELMVPGSQPVAPERAQYVAASFERMDWTAFFLCGMAVAPDHQGRGIGTRLVTWQLERGRELGYARALLMVWADNVRAVALYRRLGFAITAEIDLPSTPDLPHRGGLLQMMRDT